MKRYLILTLMACMLLSACTSRIPSMKLDIPAEARKNEVYMNFMNKYTRDLKAFAKDLESQYKSAMKAIEGKVFDSLSLKEQARIVKKDMDYAAMWLAQNVKMTEMRVEAFEVLNALPDTLRASFSKNTLAMQEYVTLLRKAYKEDLKLDPHSKEIEDFKESKLVDSLIQVGQKMVDEAKRINQGEKNK